MTAFTLNRDIRRSIETEIRKIAARTARSLRKRMRNDDNELVRNAIARVLGIRRVVTTRVRSLEKTLDHRGRLTLSGMAVK